MNAQQRVVLWLGLALVLVAGLFPPWVRTFAVPGMHPSSKPAGYRFIMRPPVAESDGRAFGVELDVDRLVVEWVMAVLVVSVLVVTLATRRVAVHPVEAGQVIQAERFEVVDARGKVRGALGLREGGSPVLGLVDTEGKQRAWLWIDRDECPQLALSDSDGKARAWLQIGADGKPRLLFTDDNEKVIWKAPPD